MIVFYDMGMFGGRWELKGIQIGRERTENLYELAGMIITLISTYADPDNENQPSGITIYADREVKEEQEDGEIIETNPPPEPKRKMTC
ncbi:hypothetical protein Q3G72_024071 [Acer saccharum]|nr:hypothetical protein Q3G72_024071 [Acer saccharum]